MTANHTTCTVTTTATGGKCGAAAVNTFTGTDGTVYAECAEHTTAVIAKAATVGTAIGEHVEVRRYGKVYDAIVTEVGARGAVYATFTYGNGARRTVRV